MQRRLRVWSRQRPIPVSTPDSKRRQGSDRIRLLCLSVHSLPRSLSYFLSVGGSQECVNFAVYQAVAHYLSKIIDRFSSLQIPWRAGRD
jgi:hypothetical protein